MESTEAIPWSNVVAMLGFFVTICFCVWTYTRNEK